MKVFLIAGVGDHIGYIQKRTKDWKIRYDFDPIVLKFGWRGDYHKNYAKLKDTVKELSGNEKVAVVGISAGGSTAIRLASELNNVTKVVAICSRTSRGGFMLFGLKSFPAYWESVDALGNVRLDKELLVIKPLFDEVVSVRHMQYANAKVITAPFLLHIPSIFRILSKRSNVIAQFIRQ